MIDGGAFVWPIVHDITPVNMNTQPLEVMRSNDQALITRDRMRVDVEAEFYIRVRPTREAVSIAASTLGRGLSNRDVCTICWRASSYRPCVPWRRK